MASKKGVKVILTEEDMRTLVEGLQRVIRESLDRKAE